MAKSAGLDHINPMLQSLAIPIAKLKPDPANARTHSEKNLEAIVHSLHSFGQQKPIVVKAGVVLAGNGTFEAAKRLNWTHIAALEFDKEAHLIGGYKLADNRSGELAEWDFHALADQLNALKADMDLNALGWDQHELDNLFAADWNPGAADGDPHEFLPQEKLSLTKEQMEVAQRAIAKIKSTAPEIEMTEGRAIELICADYLGGE